MTYGATVGMNYRLKAWKPFGKIRILEGNRFLDNTFVSVAAGGQLQASRLTSEIGLVNSVGRTSACPPQMADTRIRLATIGIQILRYLAQKSNRFFGKFRR